MTCPYFGKCGGCSTQHIPYEVQLENKKNNLKHAIKFDDIDIIPSSEYGYRSRMDFIFSSHGLGFREKGKWHTIVPIKECPISNEKINALLSEINASFSNVDYFHLQKQIGTFRFALVRSTSTQSAISFVLNADSTKIPQAMELIKEYAKTSIANNIVVTFVPANSDMSIGNDYVIIKGSDILVESFSDYQFSYNIQGFFQNNIDAAQKMHTYVSTLLKPYNTQQSYLLDLYGGVGTFGIINSNKFKSTQIIESYAPAIDLATKNIKDNNVTSVTTEVLDAKHLSRKKFNSPLYVITDPPRSGMHTKTVHYLNQIKPEVIIYVSCNFKQLAKELPRLSNYLIKSASLFDFFPQTNHSEVVIELVKKK